MIQKTLIWDFDGTLAIRPGFWSSTMAQVLEERYPGSGIGRDDIRPHMKNVFPWDEPDKPHPYLSPEGWWVRLKSTMALAYEAAGIERRNAVYLANLAHMRYVDPSGFILYNDAVSALERLSSKGWRHIILSNHVPELSQIVGALGIGGFFSRCISSAITGYEKPHPEAFRIALAGCDDPQNVWMVGDNIQADIEGALAMGIRAVLVHTPNPGSVKYHADNLSVAADIIESG